MENKELLIKNKLREAKEKLDKIIFPKRFSDYDKNITFLLNKLELNTLIQSLDRLEKLEKIFSDLKYMFEIKIGIDMGNEYFMEINQLDTRITELIPREDIEIFKEVLENGN